MTEQKLPAKSGYFRLACIALSFAVVTIAAFSAFGDRLDSWAGGYLSGPAPGAFLAILIFALLAADIAIPAPSSLLAASAGAVFGFPLGALIAGSGLAVGAISGMWLAQRVGERSLRTWIGEAEFKRVCTFVERFGEVAVVLSRSVPVLAETTVLVAGVSGASVARFAPAIALSSLGVGAAYAWSGSMASSGATLFLFVFAATVATPTLGWLVWRAFPYRSSVD